MVCIIIGILFGICVLAGWIQGLFKVLISAAGLIASIVVAMYVAPHVSGYLEKITQIDEKVAEYISTELEFSDSEKKESKGVQVAIINELPISDSLKAGILNNNNSEMYEALDVSGVYDYIAKSIAVVILNASVFLLLIFGCRIFFFFLGKATDGFTKLPIVRWVDKIGGGCLGIIKGLIFIWIFFLILSITSTFEWSQEMISQIGQSKILMLLYNNNLLLDIVGDLTKVLYL